MIYNIITYNDEGVANDVITFTIVKDMKEEYSADITDLPIETGSTISEHMRIRPVQIDLNGLVTNYSYFNSDNAIWWDGEKFTTMNEQYFVDPTEQHLLIKEKLKSIYKSKRPFTLIGVKDVFITSSETQTEQLSEMLNNKAIEKFNNCLLANASFPKASGERDVLNFSLTIKQVIFTEIIVSTIDSSSVKKVVAVNKGTSETGLDANGDPALKKTQEDAQNIAKPDWTKEESQRDLDNNSYRKEQLEERSKKLEYLRRNNPEKAKSYDIDAKLENARSEETYAKKMIDQNEKYSKQQDELSKSSGIGGMVEGLGLQ